MTATEPTTSTAAQTQTAPDPPPAETTALFSPAQIGVATLVATPIAGALLASSNLAQRGRTWAGRVVVVVATIVVAAIVGLDTQGYGALTLDVSPLWALAALIAASVAFKGEGGRKHTAVVVVVVAVWAALGLVGGVAFAAMKINAPSPDEISADSVVHADFEVVHFENGATRADAEAVERALTATGYFDGTKRLRVVVDRPNNDKLRLTMLALPPLHEPEARGAKNLVHAVATQLGHCVVGRLVAPNGDALLGGTTCP